MVVMTIATRVRFTILLISLIHVILSCPIVHVLLDSLVVTEVTSSPSHSIIGQRILIAQRLSASSSLPLVQLVFLIYRRSHT